MSLVYGSSVLFWNRDIAIGDVKHKEWGRGSFSISKFSLVPIIPKVHTDDPRLSPPGPFSSGTAIFHLSHRTEMMLALEWLKGKNSLIPVHKTQNYHSNLSYILSVSPQYILISGKNC